MTPSKELSRLESRLSVQTLIQQNSIINKRMRVVSKIHYFPTMLKTTVNKDDYIKGVEGCPLLKTINN